MTEETLMDLFLTPLALAGIIFLLMVVLSLLFSFHGRNLSGIKLPPGNLGWPVVGEMLQLILAFRKGCPEEFMGERMKKYSDNIFKTNLAGADMVVLCGPSGNKLLFSNENKLVVSYWAPTIDKIFCMSKNTSPRSIVSDMLKPEALKNYVSIMDRMIKQYFEKEWLPYDQVKVYPLVQKLVFSIACRLFMSAEEPAFVAKLSHHYARVSAGLVSAPINFPGTAFNRAIKAADIIRHELLPIIKQRRIQLSQGMESGMQPDLLSHFLQATDENGKFMVSEEEIANKILGLLFASFDSTTTVMTFIVYYLADHPEIYSQVFKEQSEIANGKGEEDDRMLNWEDVQKMKYSRNVLNEVMRLAPPAAGSFRHAIRDFKYAGFDIPEGWKIFWSVHTTHKNPEYFPNPEKFDPSRFEGNGPMPFTFVPFGGGPMMCPGHGFARMEILIFMHHLVRIFKWEKLMPIKKILHNPFPTPADGLPIRLLPHVVS